MAQEKLTPLFLFDDEPVRAHTDDHLALKPFSSMIAAAALGNRGPFNIGVFSGWGQGKTSVLRQARSLIDAQNKPHIVTAWVNAWQYEHEAHPIVPLLAVIINEITKTLDERKTASEKLSEGAGNLLKDLSRALRSIAYGFSAKVGAKIPGFANLEVGFVAKDMIDRDEKLSSDRDPLLDQSLYYHAYDRLEKFRGALEKTKLTDQPRIVVFIDDLDRCQPDKALHLLESLKLVLAQPGFIFVLAVDRRVIDAFLTKRYHDEFGISPDKLHGKQYMDKIIQLPLDLPHHQNRFEKYIEELIGDSRYDNAIPDEFRNLFAYDDASKAFISALAAGCSRCPRTLIRTLNYLLTDFFLRKSGFFVADKDPFEGNHEEFLRFAAVSRITRIAFGSEHERLYRRFVHDDRACEELAGYRADGPIKRPLTTALKQSAAETLLGKGSSESKDAFEPYQSVITASDCLEELFQSGLGRGWLTYHKKRQAIEGYLATRQESEPDQNSAQIINQAIRELLDLKEGIPLTDELRQQVNRLELVGASVSDVTLLQGLSNLENLSLSGTLVNDVTPLQNLANLQILSLDNTAVVDVKPLQNLANLQGLSLSGTLVSDVTSLQSLANLQVLYIDGTQVSDVTSFMGFANLRVLYLGRTPAAKNQAAIDALRKALPNCDIIT